VQQLATQRVESLTQYDERLVALRSCLQGLTEEQRELINAAYGSGNTVKRFAEGTGNAVQTLYNRLNKLRHQLLQCVEGRLATDRT
jgi:RNA polymerase sigma-70 factor (ECF subfamily)